MTYLKVIAPEAYEKRVMRTGVVDCWDDPNYRAAVEATGRKKLIMAGLTNHVCTVLPSISAREEGYEALLQELPVSYKPPSSSNIALRESYS